MDVESVLQEWFNSVSSADDSPTALAQLAEGNTIGERELADAMIAAYGIEAISPLAALVVNQLMFLESLNLDKQEFYTRLWKVLSDSVLYDTDAAKQQVLGIAITCPGMPYRQADVVTMSDEEYANRQQNLSKALREMTDMLNRRFAQKTETASAVLDVIDKQEDRADRAVMLSVLLESVRNTGNPVEG